MEIERKNISFKGEFGHIVLALNKNTGWIDLYDGDASVVLTQKDAKAILPYLQSFAETGTLEPQSPLQGDTPKQIEQLLEGKGLTDRDRHAVMDMENTLIAAQIASLKREIKAQDEHIHALTQAANDARENINMLEDLVKEWRNHWLLSSDAKSPDELMYLTAQILGEE